MSKANARGVIRNAITEKQHTIGNARSSINAIKANKAELIHVIDTISNFLGENENDLDAPRTYMYVSCYSDKPLIHVSYRDAYGFKDDSIAMLMAHLMTIGFDTAGKGYEYAESLNREFNFTRNDIDVNLDVYVRSDSPTCRKVVIGEEQVTVKKYAIECD